ncbi:MAG: hypothetical protein JNM27_02855 [Leptospirales bacterium]|nr:hypothetical protein [Leptospirales bacterium]
MSETMCASALPLVTLLEETIEIVEAMGADLYTRLAEHHSATIGMHLRHSADHVRALMRGLGSGTIEYDLREAGGIEERSLDAGISYLRSLAEALRAVPPGAESHPVRVFAYMDPNQAPREFQSTFGRELVFVLSHTVHHNALIRSIASQHDFNVPEYFGFAPSTIARLVCAR